MLGRSHRELLNRRRHAQSDRLRAELAQPILTARDDILPEPAMCDLLGTVVHHTPGPGEGPGQGLHNQGEAWPWPVRLKLGNIMALATKPR